MAATYDEAGAVVDAVDHRTIEAIGLAVRKSVRAHPTGSTCECPAIDALAALMAAGYKITKEG